MFVRQSIPLVFLHALLSLALFAIILAPSSYAQRPIDCPGNGSIHCYVTEESCGWVTEEPCGWVELGSHDSMPRSNATNEDGTKSASHSDEAKSVFVSTSPVNVNQIIEPFAMVGPCLKESLEAVMRLQGWWQSEAKPRSVEEPKISHLIEFDFLKVQSSMERRIELIAVNEPLDVESFGPSILVHQLQSFPSDPIALSPKPARENVLVGCSPMIFTLEESYMSYDMAQRDAKLWCILPTTTRPFCIRNHGNDFDGSPIWNQLDNVVSVKPQAARETVVQAAVQPFHCSAYCILEDWISTVEDWTCDESSIRQALRPEVLGQRLAGVEMRRKRVAEKVADALASRWEAVQPALPPSPAGAALLARAGASATPEAIAPAPQEIATNIAQAESSSERK